MASSTVEGHTNGKMEQYLKGIFGLIKDKEMGLSSILMDQGWKAIGGTMSKIRNLFTTNLLHSNLKETIINHDIC